MKKTNYIIKKALVLIFAICILISCDNKEKFIGVIKYKLSYNVAPDSIAHLDLLRNTFGDSCDLLFDGRNVELKMLNAKIWKGNTYSNKDNMLYNFTYDSDSILYIDCSEKDETIQSFKIFKNIDTILNHPCDLLIINSIPIDTSLVGVKRIKYFYFTHDFDVDMNTYSRYIYNSQDFIAKKTGGIFLKMIDSLNNFSMTYEAIEIKRDKNVRINTNFDKNLLTKMK